MRYLQAEQDDTVHDYKPWQKAKLADSRIVWIMRQKGDGTSTWYEAVEGAAGEPGGSKFRVELEQIEVWL